jgi:hypothetical protein
VGEFKTLFNEVASKVQEYSTESGDPLDTLKARLPALCALERVDAPAQGNEVPHVHGLRHAGAHRVGLCPGSALSQNQGQ